MLRLRPEREVFVRTKQHEECTDAFRVVRSTFGGRMVCFLRRKCGSVCFDVEGFYSPIGSLLIFEEDELLGCIHRRQKEEMKMIMCFRLFYHSGLKIVVFGNYLITLRLHFTTPNYRKQASAFEWLSSVLCDLKSFFFVVSFATEEGSWCLVSLNVICLIAENMSHV